MKLDIKKVADLARLTLSTEEKGKLEKDLNNILSYIEKLNSLQTKGIPSTSHVLDIENVYRNDTVSNTSAAQEVLDALPQHRKENNFFKVPKVIDAE